MIPIKTIPSTLTSDSPFLATRHNLNLIPDTNRLSPPHPI